MFKKIILVTILAILIGVILVLGNNLFSDKKLIQPKVSPFDPSTPSPQPTPTLPPINEKTNLNEEIKTLTPKDYSQEIENLKKSI